MTAPRAREQSDPPSPPDRRPPRRGGSSPCTYAASAAGRAAGPARPRLARRGLLRSVRALAAAALLALAMPLILPLPAHAQTEVWSATLNVRALSSSQLGCAFSGANGCDTSTVLSDNDFTHDGNSYTIRQVQLASTGGLSLEIGPTLTGTALNLTFDVAGMVFAFQDADGSVDGTSSSRRVWNSTGLSWTAGNTVPLKLLESDTTPPTLKSATVNAVGKIITLEFDEAVSQVGLPPTNAFSVTAGGNAVALQLASTGGVGVTDALRLFVASSATIYTAQTVVVTYTDPSASDDTAAAQDTAGNDAASFTTGTSGVPAVTNNSTVATPGGAPAAPTGFSATKGNRYVTLAWNPPASGADITHHEYRFKTDGSYPDDWETIPHSATGGFNEDGFTVTKLANDTAHTFQLRAVNAGGGSTAVESSAVTPSGSGRIVESITMRRYDGQDGHPYGVGDEMVFVVKFSQKVACADATSLKVRFNLGSATKEASSYAGAGTDTWWYRYTVQEDDVDSDGIEIPAGSQALPDRYYSDNGCNNVFDETGIKAQGPLPDRKVDGVYPSLDSAAVNGAELVLTWDETLRDDSLPVAGDFAVTVTGSSRDVSSVAVAGSAVTLTLASAVERETESIFVSYTPGSTASDRLKDLASNDAPAVSNQQVTNKTPDTTPPAITSARVSASGTLVRLEFGEDVFGTEAPAEELKDAFSVTVNSAARTITSIGNVGRRRVTLGVDPVIYKGRTVTVGYDQSAAGANALDDDAGNKVVSFEDFAVTNESTQEVELNFSAAPGDGQVVLSWEAPASGSGVTRHEYRQKEGTGSYPANFTQIPNSGEGGANEAGYTVTGLTNETVYTFELRPVAGTAEGTASESDAVTPTPGICGRTAKIQEVILAELADVSECAAVTVANLASITTFGLSALGTFNQGITSLQAGDFAGLTALTQLNLSQNQLTTLPEGIFSGLTAVEGISMEQNQLTALPEGMFAGLPNLTLILLTSNSLTAIPPRAFAGLTGLTDISLGLNDLTALPAGLFSDLTTLENISLADNDLTALPAGLFTGLTVLDTLYLGGNELSSLDAGVFSGLTTLELLELDRNDLSSLPAGVFSGLTALTGLVLDDNPNTDDVLPLTVTVEKFGTDRARAKVLAGAPAALSFNVTVVNGSLPTGVTNLAVAAGSVEGTAVTVTRTSGTVAAVTVDIDLSTQPTLASGFTGFTFAKATSGLPATILPDTRSPQNFTAKPGDGRAVLAWDAPASGSGVTKHQYHYKSGTGSYPANWEDIPNSAAGEANEDGYTVPNLTNETVYTFELRTVVGTTEGTASESDPVTPTPGICDRTQQVRDGILAKLADVAECEAVTVANLAGIGRLDLDDKGIASLKAGDFAGLTGMTTLILNDNDLTSLPAGVFSGLTALSSLFLVGNDLSSLPANVFSGLTSLGNINLRDNDLNSLPANVFSGLTSLWDISLRDNDLSSLPATVFSGLTSLINIDLLNNDLTSLPDGLFSGLTGLENLVLGANPNSGDELPLTVTLEKVGEDRVRAKVPTGAPFAVAIPVTPANGTLAGGVTMLTVAAGSVGSAAVTVTRTEGTTAAVTVDVDLTNQPSLPPSHLGYFFARAASGLPAEILPEEASLEPPTGLSATPGDRQAVLAWTPPASDSGFTRHQYRYRTTGDFVDWTDIPDSGPGGANASRYTATDLANAVEHTFELRARDAGAGRSDPATVTVEPTGPPRILSVEVVSGPGLDNGTTYGAGEAIRIAVTFDQPVEVEGDPDLALDAGGPRLAEYHSGEGTETLVFVYVVTASDDDDDGVSVGDDALRLDGDDGIGNGAGDDAELAHDGPGAQPGHRVDGARRAGVHTHAEFTHSHAHSREQYPEHTHEGHEHPDKANDHQRRPGTHVHHAQEDPNALISGGPDVRTHDGVEHIHRCFDLKPSCNQGDDYSGRGDELGLPIEVTHSHEDSEPGHGFGWRTWFEEGGSGATVSVADAEAVRGEDATLDFEVTLDPAQAFAVRVDYATADGTATAGEDYRETAGVLEIPPGQTRATVPVRIPADGAGDGPELFELRLGSATAATVADAAATGTIRTPAPSTPPAIEKIGVASTPRLSSRGTTNRDTYGEGETIRIEVRFDQPVVVDGEPTFALEVGDPCLAACEADYESGSGTNTLVFAYLVLEVDIDRNGIAIRGNPIEVVSGDSIRNAADQDARLSSKGKGTQRNHKTDGSRSAASHLSVEDAEAREADGEMAFTVRLEPHGLGIVTVDYATADGTGDTGAVAGEDYTETRGTLTFDPLETQRTVTVPIIDDAEPDDGETFTLTLSNPDGATLGSGDGRATGTIRNSEPQEALTASFEDMPAAHDGSAFTFRVAFSRDIGISYKALREDAFAVSGGRVTGGKRVDDRRDLFEMTVAPDGGGAVAITLEADRDCAASGAICTKGEPRRRLTNSPSATVAGPDGAADEAAPLTARFEDMPAEHRGEGGFRFRAAFSEDIGISYKALREDAFAVSGGRVTGGKRVDDRRDLFEMTVRPDGGGDVGIALEAGRECAASGAICTKGEPRRRLTNSPSATVAGPGEAPANTPAEGAPAIEGTARVGGALTASTAGVTDADGLENAEFAHQWLRGGADIPGATGASYTAVEADLGERLKVRVAFEDDAGNAERRTSAATDAVEAAPRANTPAEGAPAIRGKARIGGTLTASTADIADEDGLDNAEFAHQWLRGGADISGATGATYTVVEADLGERLKVRVAFADDAGNAERLTSAATDAVEAAPRANTPADGAPAIRGKARVGGTLTASTSGVSDADGLANAVFRYQWLRGGADIPGATGAMYAVVDADEGERLKARVEFADDAGNEESLTSAATKAVAARPRPKVSVADARVREAAGATLDFAVTLSAPAPGAVTVGYRTLDASAKAGEDYEARAGKLRFGAGETAKTLRVTVLDDAVDEGDEKMVVVLEPGAGVDRGDRLASGTIENSDPLPAAWLVRFGRTASDHAVEAVEERFRDPGGASHATFGGRRLWGGGGLFDAPAHGGMPGGPFACGPFGGAAPPDRGADLGTNAGIDCGTGAGTPPGMNAGPNGAMGAGMNGGMSAGTNRGLNGGLNGGMDGAPRGPSAAGGYRPRLRDLLLGSSFRLSASGADAAGAPRRLTAWGRAAATRFDGVADGVAVDGEVATFLVGADASWNRWLAGITVAHSVGAGGFRGGPGGGAGGLDSTLTAVHPYARWQAGERLSAWGVLGYGAGDLALETNGSTWETDTSMRMAAGGLRGVFLRGAGGLELAARTDLRVTRIASDGVEDNEAGLLAAAAGGTSRVRLLVEGSRPFRFGERRLLTPTLELGVRRDGGDAETGTGIDLGGSLRYADAALGLTAEASGRYLVAHEDAAYREWGASASVRIDPGAAGRGLTLSVMPSWGASATGGAERLWSVRDARGLAGRGFDAAMRLRADVGYGLSAFRGMGAVTPFLGLSTTGPIGRDWRLGARWTRGAALRMSLEATRREAAGVPPAHGIQFGVTWRPGARGPAPAAAAHAAGTAGGPHPGAHCPGDGEAATAPRGGAPPEAPACPSTPSR